LGKLRVPSGRKACHILAQLGASGSGTSTLGDALAQSFGYFHLDTDDYFWEPAVPPFQQPRARPQRHALLGAALDAHPRWVLSGALCGWGDLFIPRFDLVIFLCVPREVRIARLKAREHRRFGQAALAPGGARHDAHVAFMSWAAAYDGGARPCGADGVMSSGSPHCPAPASASRGHSERRNK
jgi:adenylate kinase family enzyme